MTGKREFRESNARLNADLNRLSKAVEKALSLMSSCVRDLDHMLDVLAEGSPHRFKVQSVRDRINDAAQLLDSELKASEVSAGSVKGVAVVGQRSTGQAIELTAALAQIASLPVALGAWLAPLADHATAARSQLEVVVVTASATDRSMIRVILQRANDLWETSYTDRSPSDPEIAALNQDVVEILALIALLDEPNDRLKAAARLAASFAPDYWHRAGEHFYEIANECIEGARTSVEPPEDRPLISTVPA